MKPVIHTSLRWLQQHLRHLAYLEKQEAKQQAGQKDSEKQEGATRTETATLLDINKTPQPR